MGAWEHAQLAILEPDGTPTDIPYGSAQWLALPIDDPRRGAALIRAAADWRRTRAPRSSADEGVLGNSIVLGAFLRHMEDHMRRSWEADMDRAEAAAWEPVRARIKAIADTPTWAERMERRKFQDPWQLQATPGWPPIAMPGRSGTWRHLIDGQQVDLPCRERLEAAA